MDNFFVRKVSFITLAIFASHSLPISSVLIECLAHTSIWLKNVCVSTRAVLTSCVWLSRYFFCGKLSAFYFKPGAASGFGDAAWCGWRTCAGPNEADGAVTDWPTCKNRGSAKTHPSLHSQQERWGSWRIGVLCSYCVGVHVSAVTGVLLFVANCDSWRLPLGSFLPGAFSSILTPGR